MDEKKGITVSIRSGDKTQITSNSGPIIRIQNDPVHQGPERNVDLIFVIDTTGSMSDKIEGLLSTCARFVDEFANLKLSHRIAIVSFGDLTVPGDKIESTSFTDKIEVVKRSLKNIPRNGGGGNEGESSLEAIEKALDLPFRANAVKVIILITDEPALQHRIRPTEINDKLQKNEFLAFVVSPPLAYFQEMAKRNGGRWYPVSAKTDFTDLLDMFKNIATKVSKVVSDVYELGDGSVSTYLQLKPPDK